MGPQMLRNTPQHSRHKQRFLFSGQLWSTRPSFLPISSSRSISNRLLTGQLVKLCSKALLKPLQHDKADRIQSHTGRDGAVGEGLNRICTMGVARGKQQYR